MLQQLKRGYEVLWSGMVGVEVKTMKKEQGRLDLFFIFIFSPNTSRKKKERKTINHQSGECLRQ